MNTKVTFLLLLVLLIILMLFYYIDLESNIIILLGVVIVLIIHNLIAKKEHFNINEQAARLEAQIDSLTAVAEALRARSQSPPTERPSALVITRSCPFKASTTQRDGITALSDPPPGFADGVNLGTEFGTSLEQLNATNLRNMFNPQASTDNQQQGGTGG